MGKPITIFISYAHKDETYLQELQTFLKPFVRNQIINVWTDRDIVAGQQWNELIKAKLDESEVILFLVSPDFLASDYINDTEIKSALDNKRLTIVSILVRPTEMSLFQMNNLQVVPSGAKAVTKWENKDEAWNDVIRALKTVFDRISNQQTGQTTVPDLVNMQGHSISHFTTNKVTDALMKWLFLLLIIFCMCVFAFGILNGIRFYCFTSLAGIAAAFVGYLFMRKF